MKIYLNTAALSLMLFLSSCVVESHIDEPAEPVLQIDATLVAGQAIPEIKIRKGFKATGPEPFEVPKEDLWAEGAEVALMHNGEIIDLYEHSPGRFHPSDASVEVIAGQSYSIEVSWDGLDASATADVPLFNLDIHEINISEPVLLPEHLVLYYSPPSGSMEGGRYDTLLNYQSRVSINQAVQHKSAIFQIASTSELSAINFYSMFSVVQGDPEKYTTIYNDDVTSSLTYETDVSAYFDINSSPESRDKLTSRIVAVVPENIYADYSRVESTYFTPITITNVENGVGLFIGAVRDTVYIDIPINP